MAFLEGTVGNIVEKAVGLAQLDLSFKPLATDYLNTILRNWSSNGQWQYFRKEEADQLFVTGQVAYDLPEDYSRADDCYIKVQATPTNQQGPQVQIINPTRFRQMRTSTIEGVPRIAYIDLKNREIVFESAPTSGTYYYSLAYFRLSDIYDIQGGDDETPVDFENADALIQEITAWLMKYTDDERQLAQDQDSGKSQREARMNSFDQDGDSVSELASAKFKPGMRPTRGGGGSGGWMGN